uniref:Uncharacterized protein n=1 Tax=Physcomitrium patens TaxID=3218 RepID=A0A2K1IXZ6_PHYPA|nr:hypothetical protein PHYPA_023977 [Physcomitrium patens]
MPHATLGRIVSSPIEAREQIGLVVFHLERIEARAVAVKGSSFDVTYSLRL